MKRPLTFIALGALFGFCLSRAFATDYDTIRNMFLLRDLHLMLLMGVATVVAGVGMRWLARGTRSLSGEPITVAVKPTHRGNLWGGFIFGVGWALCGTCPGTALAQIGEGKVMGLFSLGGMVAGTWLYGNMRRTP